MMKGIHVLLTYSCTYRCDHCFLHCSPESRGTFTSSQLREVFRQIELTPTVETVYFEGGESFLYYPLLLEGLRFAARSGLRAGIVTNGYWATSVQDAELWLKPIAGIGLADLSISDDEFHRPSEGTNSAGFAVAAATNLGIPCDTISIAPPAPSDSRADLQCKGQPVIGGEVMFRGRAAETLTAGLRRRPCAVLTSCPHEDLETPSRVHVDCYGNVHICQGLSMGNMWETPLHDLVRNYAAARHPICGPLSSGGPSALAKQYGINLPDDFVDECHYCYTIRKSLVDRFAVYLAPKQVYGLSQAATQTQAPPPGTIS
jgi:hypothetical protein